MNAIRIVLIPPHAEGAAAWFTAGPDGHVLSRGEASPEAPLEAPRLRVVAVAPAGQTLVRRVTLAAGAAPGRAAVLAALKDDLATPPERLRVAVGAAEADGSAWAAVAGDSWLSAWIDWLDAAGMRPDSLMPDGLVLPEPETADMLHVAPLGAAVILRGRDMAASVDAELVETLAAGRRLVPLDEAAVQRALASAALNPPLDLMTALKPEAAGGWRAWRLAAVLAAGLLASPVLLDAASAARDTAAAAGLSGQARTEAGRVFPDLSGRDDAQAAAVRRLKTTPPGGAAAAAAVLFAAVEAVEGAEVEAFSAAPDAGVRATVRYPAWSDLETMRAVAAGQGLALDDVSTLEENGRVVSDLVLEAGR